jgi:hypothetical protein
VETVVIASSLIQSPRIQRQQAAVLSKDRTQVNHIFTRRFSFLIMLPIESLVAPKLLNPSHRKVCKHYRQGRCQLENDCIFLHPQEQQPKSLIKAPDTSLGLSCRPDSPLERPNGEDDNTSLEAHAHEFEGDINDNTVHDDSQDRMDQAPYSDDEFNGNHPDPPHPSYNDEAYKEQPDNGPSNLSHRTDSVDRDYVNPVEPVNKCFKPAREERSPPPPATQLQARQPLAVALPVVPSPPKYPHVSEIIPHWTQFADPHASKDVPFCKQLAQGGCWQSDRCRFRHSLTVEEYTLLFNDQQPNLWTLQRDGVNEAAVSFPTSQPQVDSPHIDSAVAVKSSTFGQECKFYPIGKCHNGDRCPFQHTQHPPAPVATVSNADQDQQTSERPTQNLQRPCHFHFERGFCHRGRSCKFTHGDVDGNHPSFGPSGPESAPILVDGDEGGRENQANINNSDADTPAEDNGWGAVAAANYWDLPSNTEDHSAWDSPSGNENGGWPPTDNSSHSVPWTTAPRVQCPYYLKGNCRNDTSCHMSHGSEEKPQGGRSEESYEAENPKNEPGEIVQNETQSTWDMEREPKTLSENEPKVQEGDSQILDNEVSWSQSWHMETVQPTPFPMKIDAPCKRFGQGYCPFKNDCTYLHIIEDSDIVERTSNSEEIVSVSISLK